MSDFIEQLIRSTINPVAAVRPRPMSMFEPSALAEAPLPLEDIEETEHPPAPRHPLQDPISTVAPAAVAQQVAPLPPAEPRWKTPSYPPEAPEVFPPSTPSFAKPIVRPQAKPEEVVSPALPHQPILTPTTPQAAPPKNAPSPTPRRTAPKETERIVEQVVLQAPPQLLLPQSVMHPRPSAIIEQATANAPVSAPTPIVQQMVLSRRRHPTRDEENDEVNSQATVPQREVLRPSPPSPEKHEPRPATEMLRPLPAPPPLSEASPISTSRGRQGVRQETAPMAATPAPTIHVTIGRVEVRATSPPAKPARPHHSQPTVMSLDEYLKQRASGGQR